jgi:hypothetical protein
MQQSSFGWGNIRLITGALICGNRKVNPVVPPNTITWVRLRTEFGGAARQWPVAKRPKGLLLRSPLLEEADSPSH